MLRGSFYGLVAENPALGGELGNDVICELSEEGGIQGKEQNVIQVLDCNDLGVVEYCQVGP